MRRGEVGQVRKEGVEDNLVEINGGKGKEMSVGEVVDFLGNNGKR